MNEAVVVHSKFTDSQEAGSDLGKRLLAGLQGEPDAVVLFASPKFDYPVLLRSLDAACRPRLLIGCSSAGEFSSQAPRDSSACALGLRSSEMAFASGVGRGLRVDRVAAARALVSSFRGLSTAEYAYRSAMVLTDALAGHADQLIEEITIQTAGTCQLFGGGAGDDAHFDRTHVFLGTEAIPDAAVALEILSNKPIGIGVRHGWVPASKPMRVTESDGMRLVSLDAILASEVFEEYARSSGQSFDRDHPLPFFLHNVLGIQTGSGYKLRVPLGVHADGSISCAADVPVGATVCIMSATAASAAQAATEAAEAAIEGLGGNRPKAAIFLDCVATRLRTGGEFGGELGALENVLGSTPFAGCNTYGQIARAEGQFEGFHNCTAAICIIPE
ncbi:MAG: FIST N-terminal domain-containing protein [Candidatus Eisenbacteria bacterium]